MKPELLRRLANAYEAAVEKQFKKLRYSVTRQLFDCSGRRVACKFLGALVCGDLT